MSKIEGAKKGLMRSEERARRSLEEAREKLGEARKN